MIERKEQFPITFTLRNDTATEVSRKKINLSESVRKIIEECNIANENDRQRTVRKTVYLPVDMRPRIDGIDNVSKTIDDNLSLLFSNLDDYNKDACNGWKNWETWNTNLWLTNDYDTYQDVLELVAVHKSDLYAFHKALADYWDGLIERDVVKDQISKHRIDWREVATAIIGGTDDD